MLQITFLRAVNHLGGVLEADRLITHAQIAGLLGYLERKGKGYLGLALINFDHFGEDARTAYKAGHLAALRQAASSKSPANLESAYALNAFADHFLEDSFAAGHLRVPRQKLHSPKILDWVKADVFPDLCAQVSQALARNIW